MNLYYPYAKHVGVPNPFGNHIQLTSLEKALKTESNGYDVNQRKNVIIWGFLSVTVISAEYMPPMYIGGKANPFVVLYLKRWVTKKKTRVIIFPNLRVMYVHIFFQGSHNSVLLQVVTVTLNPIWNQTFDSLYKMHCMICSWWIMWPWYIWKGVHYVSCILFVHLKSKTPYLDSLWLRDITSDLSLCYSL